MKKKSNRKKILINYAAISLTLNLCFFSSLYFFNKSFEFWLLVITHLVVAAIYWAMQSLKLPIKIVAILLGIIVSSVIGFVLVLSSMYIPGSREHNYVMYKICMPQIEQYYKDRELHMGSLEHQGQNGELKWWYQHVECEDNFYAGKGPVFSDSPPGFIPEQ